MAYFGPETMFLLSLEPEQRDYLTDAVNEALKLRAEGLNDYEISGRLAHAILAIEGWTETTPIVRKIVLGTYAEAS